MSSTRVSRHVKAPRERVYEALLDAPAVAQWLVPQGMTGQVHAFDAREGGAFRISLTYDGPGAGKTTASTDTYHGRFVRLVPHEIVVQTMEFETHDPAMRGEMTATYTLRQSTGGTLVEAVHDHLPPGLAQAGNELGWRMALDALATLVEAPSAPAPYPRTIDNGAGERITFLRRVPGATGERVEGENVAAPGAGPPMHVHHYQVESFTVQRGRIGYQRLGGPEQFAGPGETVAFAPGEAHRFWNPGPDDLHCTGYIEPADNVEYFLGEIFASARRRGGPAPALFDAAFLATRYRDEFTMVAIPAPVRRFVFPLLVALGTVLGKYRKYADAPAPVRR